MASVIGLTPRAFAAWLGTASFSPWGAADEAFEGAVLVIRFGMNGQDGLPQEPRRTVGLGASLSFYVAGRTMSQGESVASRWADRRRCVLIAPSAEAVSARPFWTGAKTETAARTNIEGLGLRQG